MTKKSEEKLLTEVEEKLKNGEFKDEKELFSLLDQVREIKCISVSKMAKMIGMPKTSYFRYINDYDSQSSTTPKLKRILCILDVLGYEMTINNRIVDKNIENHEK